MDDLLQHCMRELAFDGDLGCDVSRLRHFIEAFYISQESPRSQTVDDSFHGFVWSLLVQQPSVRVGLVPKGSTIEVYIAPQLSKRTKVTKPKKKKLVPEPAPFPAREERAADASDGDEVMEPFPGRLQPIDGASANSLDALIQQHGNGLRVAVDPETSFRAITGSHTRPAKLSPMVYSALQLISRGREGGLSVIDLGKKTGYDQKTCFYLIKQLCELDLVVKLSKGGPGGGNFCIHKYFFTKSAFWKGVRHEEVVGEDVEGLEQNGKDSTGTQQTLQFDSIDSRHLASVQLIKTRLSRLLKHSENGLHAYKNLLPTLGFANPTRRDRRFFIVRIRELIKEGFIEKVVVPRVHGLSETLCIRLVEDSHSFDADGVIVQPIEVGDDEQEANATEDKERDMPVVNLTIHRQILKLLEEAGHDGLTLNDISARLGNFDKRTVELFLSRLERSPPPPHLADLATCDFIENKGRERRLRFYTLPGYLSFIHRENIDHAGRTAQYTSRDFSHSGEFYPLTKDLFYEDEASLVAYEDGYRNKSTPREGGTRKLGRPRKDANMSKTSKNVPEVAEETLVPVSRGKRTKLTKDVADAEIGSESRDVTQKPSQRGAKRKWNADAEEGGSDSRPPIKKRRGRQPTPMNADPQLEGPSSKMDVDVPAMSTPVSSPRRGRSSRKAVNISLDRANSGDAEKTVPDPVPQTSRIDPGRKPIPTAAVSSPSTYVYNEPNNGLPAASASNVATTLDTLTTSLDHLETSDFSIATSHDTPTTRNGHTQLPAVSGSTGISQDTLSGSPRFASNPSIGLKRTHDLVKAGVAESGPPLPKRAKSGRSRPHALVNISQMRAENEFMRVVEASEGITNISSKEFLDTHALVIATMVDAGESTSMPVGTHPDRRTIRKVIEKLEERGRLQTLTVIVTPRVGQPRPVKIAYAPEVPQNRIDKYLAALREGIPTLPVSAHKKLEQPLGYTRPKRNRARDAPTQLGPPRSGKETEGWRRDSDISGLDDDTIRSAILQEVQTVAQLYGFLIGKARRARELHQFTLAHLQEIAQSPHVVSRAERIVAFSYYHSDLPVSTYFAIISATGYNTELFALMETPQDRQTLVKNLPTDLHDRLQIGRARARDKIFGLLVILASLKLVTPLQPSTSETPYLVCEPNGEGPTHFDIAPISEARYSASSPKYWRFETIAPIFLYSMTETWPPPFHRDVFVRTADESMQFWFELENACLNKEYQQPMTSMDSITGSCACTIEVARGLRRRDSWVSSYVLSWHQRQYLYRWIDPSTGYTPLSDADGGRACLEHACSVISAPIDAVYQFYTTSHSMFMKETKRIRKREQKRQEQYNSRTATEDRTLLANKAAEARRQLEADWDALVQRVLPASALHGSGTKLKQLRTRYMQSRASMNNEKWEAAVREASSGPRTGKSDPVLSTIASSMPHKTARRIGIPRLPPVSLNQQKSVTELIERQKERVAVFQAIPPKKKNRQESSVDPDVATSATEGPRRQRFQWTSEYDELARDASAIIRSRCRTWNRMDWTALDQLFPFLPRNNVRQRIAALRQEAGGESYLRLLEDKWHELWLEHRGTEALPDEKPTSPSEFDAVKHVEFLRKYIDKRSLRVGLINDDMQNAAGTILTETISDFFLAWNVTGKLRPFNKMDVVWTAIGDEHRERAFLGEAFSLGDTFDVPTVANPLSNGVAESGLKMTLTTHEEDYDANNATLFLNSIGRDSVRQASEELLARGVISESGTGQRKRPGRKLKISSLNEDALGGSFHSDFYAEACTTEDMFDDDTDGWREWSVTATDGGMAAFIELVSEGKLEFQIDISGAVSQLQQLDWNSKKVDDDHLATNLAVRFHPLTLDDEAESEDVPDFSAPLSVSMNLDEASDEHGQSYGETAPCSRTSQGIITCSACLTAEQHAFLASLDPESRTSSAEFMERLDSAGRNGLSREALRAYYPNLRGIGAVIDQMVSGAQCYWVGYAYPVLVSRHHIRDWTVSIPGLSMPRLVFPRRWLNIKGEWMGDVWNAGLRALVGILVARPGIPQVELRQRLISVYDRQELNDLLHHLHAEGLIAKRVSPENPNLQFKDLRAMSTTEERETSWTLTWNAWYRVNINE